MSYQKEIPFRDYIITFEYDVNEGLNLLNWTAYEGNNEITIPCRVESEFIEKQLHNWLDNEWYHNGSNYIEDVYIDRMERRLNMLEDR